MNFPCKVQKFENLPKFTQILVHDENLYIIYFGIFSSLLNYGAQIWGQYHNCHIKRVTKLQDKAIRIINFAHFRESTSKLYKKSKILKFKDSITLNNYLYVVFHMF